MDGYELKEHYGTITRAAKEIGVSRQTFHRWLKCGVPEDVQIRLHRNTKGHLRADSAILAKYREILRAA